VSKGPDAFRTISEVADDLDLPQHVLRFWETRFTQIKPLKRGGGRRYYRPDDIDLLRGIRQLLYGEGYTIKGVQRILKEQGPRFVIGAGRGEVEFAAVQARRASDPREAEAEGEFDEIDDDAGYDATADYDEEDAFAASEREAAATPSRTRRLVEHLVPGVRTAAPGGAGLGADDVTKLQATLAELLECKRLLDRAR